MAVTTHEAGHPALLDYLADLLREALAGLAAANDSEDDIDWEDGEPEEEAERAA